MERLDEIIVLGNLECKITDHLIKEAEMMKEREAKAVGNPIKRLRKKEIEQTQKIAREALRCCVAKRLTGEAYRVFSAHLADSVLLQRFCGCDQWGSKTVKVPSKSTLHRYEQLVPETVIRDLVMKLTQTATRKEEGGVSLLNLEAAISLDDYYGDLTVIKTHIHFPTDWVLLKDGVHTLCKALRWIRKSGLKHRMQPPEHFMKQMNRYAMAMTHSRRQKESKTKRKRLLRLMKKMVTIVRNHAQRHHDLLETHWEEAGLKAGEVKQVLGRIEHVLSLLPTAVTQAHDRIIGERQVKSAEKVLSLYEPDTRVIVRGKAGAEVEFGNTAYMSEQADGVITDWRLYKDAAPSDAACLMESLDRLKNKGVQPKQVTGDRGTFSKRNGKLLMKREIRNNLCPRTVQEMKERYHDKDFAYHHMRRGQTEGRLGILKHCFLGSPFRSKGFESRERGLAWSILAHNLWVLARLPRADTEPVPLPLAA